MQHSSCLQCLSIASTSTGWVPLDPTVATEKTQDCRTMDVPQLGVPYFSPYSHCLGSCLPLLGPSIVLIYITHKPLFVSRSLSRLPTAVLLFFFPCLVLGFSSVWITTICQTLSCLGDATVSDMPSDTHSASTRHSLLLSVWFPPGPSSCQVLCRPLFQLSSSKPATSMFT